MTKKTRAQLDAEIEDAIRAMKLAERAPLETRERWLKRFPVGTVVERKDRFARGHYLSGLVVESDPHARKVRVQWAEHKGTSNHGQWHPITQIQALTRPRKTRS